MRNRKFNNRLSYLLISLVLLSFNFSCTKEFWTSPGTPEDSIKVTTDLAYGHQHSFYIPKSDIDNELAIGNYYSSYTGHSHELILTQSDFQLLNDGQYIIVQTSFVDEHYHDVMISYPFAGISLDQGNIEDIIVFLKGIYNKNY